MLQEITTYLSAPPLEDPKHHGQARMLNRMIYYTAGCALLGLILALVNGAFGNAIIVGLLLVPLAGAKVLLQQRKMLPATLVLFGALTTTNLIFTALRPEFPILGMILAFLALGGLLLLGKAVAFFVYFLNIIGAALVLLFTHASASQQWLMLLWSALTVLFVLLLVITYERFNSLRTTEQIQTAEQLVSENKTLRTEVEQFKEQMSAELETRKRLEMRLHDEANQDRSQRFNAQTGVYTEATLLDIIQQEISRTQRYSRPLSLLAIRVDNMYDITARSGLTPSKLLSILSESFIHSLRREDAIGHFGIDGFYVLLPETGRYASYVVAERLRHLVELMTLFDTEEGPALTISIGLTAYQDMGKMTSQTFSEQAQEALAAAEKRGGNWTFSWHDLTFKNS